MKRIIRLVFAMFFILFCNVKIAAQNNHVDSVAKKLGDLSQAESFDDTTYSNADKDLKRNSLSTDDSVNKYKQDREFAYINYLDSLLRKTKDLTVDTFSVSVPGSSGNKKNVQQNSRSLNTSPRLNIFNLPWVKMILWILAVFLIGFIIYKLFLGENFFRKNFSYKNTQLQKVEEDLSDPSGYDNLIANAVADKNFRLATRYAYLQTLKILANKGLLQFAADKTNYQYVNELSGKSYQNDFAAITLNYEYVWYGKFEIDEDVYNTLSNEYKMFHKKV